MTNGKNVEYMTLDMHSAIPLVNYFVTLLAHFSFNLPRGKSRKVEHFAHFSRKDQIEKGTYTYITEV